jgi:hypothetical protein
MPADRIDPVTPERLALAQRFLDAVQYDRFRSEMEKSNPMGASLAFAGVDQAEVRRVTAEAYATHLSDDELLALIEFFESPVGRKYRDTQPLVVEATKSLFSISMPDAMEQIKRMLGEGPPRE